jgi:hypothetical protein
MDNTLGRLLDLVIFINIKASASIWKTNRSLGKFQYFNNN